MSASLRPAIRRRPPRRSIERPTTSCRSRRAAPSPYETTGAHVPSNALAAIYLAATTVPLAVAVAQERAKWTRLAAHGLMLAAATVAARASTDRRPALGAVAALLPLLFVPPMYAELPSIAAGLGGGMHDATVLRWEHALFGESLARTLSARAPWPLLSEVLHAGYLSYYALIYGPPLRLALTGHHRALGETAFTVLLAFVSCYGVFAVFPVQGPWFEWPAPTTIPDGPLRRLVERILRAGSARGTAFPSSHVAVSVAQTLVTLRHQPRLGRLAAACTATLAAGAVYGGLHYAIDVVVGAAVGGAVGIAGPRLFNRLAG